MSKNTATRFLLAVFFLRLLAAPLHLIYGICYFAFVGTGMLFAMTGYFLYHGVNEIVEYFVAPVRLLIHNWFHFEHKTYICHHYNELNGEQFAGKLYRCAWGNTGSL